MSAAKQFRRPEQPFMTPAEARLDGKLSRCHFAITNPSPPGVQVGAVMIQEGALLPEGVSLESDRYTTGWRAVKTINGFGVDRKIRAAGWNLFLIAGEVKAIALGSARNRVRRALSRVLAIVRSRRFNSAEVTAIVSRHFLGIPYTAVTVQARHVQQGYALQGARLRARAQQDADWARA